MPMTLDYGTLSADLAEFWGDAWEDPYAREWEHLAKLTWRVLRRRGSLSFAWTLDAPDRRLDDCFRSGRKSVRGYGWDVPPCPRLADLHEDMAKRWDAFVARYPRFELRMALQDVSESVDASSWPYRYEWKLWRWAGEPLSPPPVALRGLYGAEHHATLARLRAATDGWWVWVDGPPGRREFGTIEWRTAAEMDALAAERESER